MHNRKLNMKGKLMIGVLLIVMVTLFTSVVIKTVDAKQNTTSSQSTDLEKLSMSFEKVSPFTKSKLHQSIEQKRKKEQQRRQKQQEQDRKTKSIYLTFDDGPTNESGQLLHILNQYHAKATFFMIGTNMKAHPAIAKRMVNEGFSVGLHSMTHDPKKVYANPKAPLNEMTQAQQILQNITGVKSTLIRLPYGSVPYLTNDARTYLAKKNFKIWDWNIDSKDWELKNKKYVNKVIQGIHQMERNNETPIILMHDKPITIKYLPSLLNYLQKHGYKMKKITNDTVPLTFQCYDRCHPFKKQQ